MMSQVIAFLGRPQILLSATIVALSGCKPTEEIRTYTVPKTAAPRAVATTPAETGQPVDRMLTVVVPESGRAWFYKVVGPIPAVDAREKEIIDFVAGTPPAAGSETPAWTLPQGWTSRPGTDGVTLATIQVPTDDKPLDLTVTALPWSGTPDDLLRNVNRWRGQMGLPQANTAAELAGDVREMKADGRTVTIVDLRGRFRRSMMPPFAGGGSSSAGAAARGGRLAMPADHPPLGDRKTPPADSVHGGATPAAEAPPAAPKFAAPASWQPAPAGGMNRAVFRVPGDGAEAAVTISSIPSKSGAMFADPLQTANLWRRGVGLPDITADELADASKALSLDGRPATYVSAIPDAGKPEATLAAMVTHGEHIWYFKIKGPRQLVVDRQDEFKAFLKSVKFAEEPLP
jgi:hypothetical protein